MFISYALLLGSALLISGSDTTKKKAPQPSPGDAKGVTQSGAPASPAPDSRRTPTVGKSIENSILKTARAIAPTTTYLSAALRGRATRGPALPANIKPDPNIVAFVADSIVVEKSRHTMTLYQQGMPVRIYFVALGQNPRGDKVSIGDNRTPEGLYHISAHNPASKFHLSLRVSYPNAQDVAEARARGVQPGGDIMIHGLPKGFESVGSDHRQRDWTNGCIAVTNAEIEEIWSAIPDGAAIHIKP